jgi:SAM-dependent methyltransferase
VALYADDLAHVQREGFGDFALQASPGLLDALRTAGLDSGTVLDLGCGAGVWLRELSRAGYRAVGIDASAALVRTARRAAPHASVRVGSIYRTALPRCDAVTAISEVLSYLPPRGRPPALAAFFHRVARRLPAGAPFLFDLMVDDRGMDYRTWRSGRDWAVLVEVSRQPERRTIERDITTFRRVGGGGGGYRRRRERHRVRITPRREVEAALRAAGFTVRVSRRWGPCELPPGRLAFRARKAGPTPSRVR